MKFDQIFIIEWVSEGAASQQSDIVIQIDAVKMVATLYRLRKS